MKRSTFIEHSLMAAAAMFLPRGYAEAAVEKGIASIRLLRHATLIIELKGQTLLVDPMLSAKEALDPVPHAANTARFPLVDLPIGQDALEGLVSRVDAVLVTHTHRDHWDSAARALIPKNKPLFCQPADKAKLEEQGFCQVISVESTTAWNGLLIHRTGGQHGTGTMGEKMGTVSGYVVEGDGHRIYIAGDTIWCAEVKEAISRHKPTHIVVNGGAAQFLEGDPITMTTADILQTYEEARVPISVVHLEAVSHCYQKRPEVKAAVQLHGYDQAIKVPDDGAVTAL